MPERSVLALAYTPAGASADVRKSVGGFLRYVQYRDLPAEAEVTEPKPVEGLLKYVAFRDRSGPRGRLFDAQGRAGDDERHRLGAFAERSLKATRRQPGRDEQGRPSDRRRAVYRMVLSPEFAGGLELQGLARAAMGNLQRDLGGEAPLVWLAAEHHNTAHPHVHIVLAGMREIEPGRFRSVVINRRRLAGMKEAVLLEIERQREERPRRERDSRERATAAPEPSQALALTRDRTPERPAPPKPRQTERRTRQAVAHLARPHRRGWLSLSLRRLSRDYLREAEWQAELERRRGALEWDR